MTESKAFDLLQSAVNDLIAGDESAIASILRALRMLGLDLETEQFLLDSVNDAIGVAIGNQINRLLTQEVVPLPKDLENKLSTILDALIPRNFDQIKQRLIRIFLSSPGDVSEERALAIKVINNLPYAPLLRGRVLSSKPSPGISQAQKPPCWQLSPPRKQSTRVYPNPLIVISSSPSFGPEWVPH